MQFPNTVSGQHRIVRGGIVGVSEILAHIDQEIAQLQKARALLDGALPNHNKASTSARNKVRKRRNLTPEGRKRIAEAVRRRWAEQKKRAASNK